MKRLIIIGVALIVLLAGVFACAKAPEPTAAPSWEEGVVVPPAPIAVGSSKGEMPPPTVIIPAPTTVPAPRPAPIPTPTPAPAGTDSYSWAGERMIVRTGNMALVVVDVAQTIEQIAQLTGSFEGYVVSSNSWREGERLVGNIAFRVPAERFDAAMGALRGMAVKINSESTSGQDVTEEYVDLSAKLHNLEAAEAQLLRLMEEKTEKVTDILEVQRELVKTRGEIEQTRGRMQYLEQSSSMSFIQVSLEQSKLDVEFNANTRNIQRGQEILFVARIAGGFSPYSYEWDFGDGGTSTSDMPTHAYKSRGNYTVTLKVTDDKGNTASQKRDNYITVLPGWSAGNTVSSAWSGFLAFGRVVVNILIWVVVFIPLWIVIGVIVYFAWWRRRKKA